MRTTQDWLKTTEKYAEKFIIKIQIFYKEKITQTESYM